MLRNEKDGGMDGEKVDRIEGLNFDQPDAEIKQLKQLNNANSTNYLKCLCAKSLRTRLNDSGVMPKQEAIIHCGTRKVKLG